MGNTTSVPTDDASDYHSISNSAELLQPEDELLTPDSSFSNYPSNSQARQELRTQLFQCSPQELQASSASHSSPPAPSNFTALGKTDRIDISEALAILRKVKQSASPEELRTLQNALLPAGTRTAPATPCVSQTEIKSPQPERPDQLTRRKSYFTPGVATREKSNKLQKRHTSTRNPSKPQDQPWSPEMFGQSPLSRLAGWESKNDGMSERAVTPDISHTYLGAHALGSLRVTNGVPSPAPSIYSKLIKKPSESSLRKHQDFFTTSDDLSKDSAQSAGPESLTNSDTTPSKGRLENPECWESVPEFQGPLVDVHSVQPLSTGRNSVTSETNYHTGKAESSWDTLPLDRSASVLKPYQHELNSNPFLDSKSTNNLDDPTGDIEPPIPSPQQLSKSPVLLYQSEANSNPFLPIKENTAIELNVPSPAGSYSNSDTGTQIHHEAIPDTQSRLNEMPLPYPTFAGPQTTFRAAASSSFKDRSAVEYGFDSAASSVYTAGSRRERREPDYQTKKHDSGYGSETSRQTSKDTLVYASISAPTSSHPSPCEERDNPATVTPQNTNRAKPVPVTRLKPALVFRSGDQADVPKPLPQAPTEAALPALSKTPLETPRPKSSPNLHLLSSPASSSNTHIAKQASGPNKLKKKRPQSQRMSSEPLVVQSQPYAPQTLGVLPQIPAHITARHMERMNEHPKMDHLEKTYKSVAHEKSRESFNSAEPFNVQIRFPSPSRSLDPKEPKEKKRDLRRSSFGAEQIQSFFRRGGERSRSGNGPHQQHYTPVDITDFGTVTGALGSSPYDLATTARDRDKRGRVPGPRASRHPHQMGADNLRAKSAIGMTDDMASEFARRKSRDRLENASNVNRPLADSNQGCVTNRLAYQGAIHQLGTSSGHPIPAERGNRPHLRPQLWPASSPTRSEDAIVAKSNANFPRRESEGTQDTQVQSLAAAFNDPVKSEPEVDWSVSANAWRIRRKSIGENLRSQATKDFPETTSAEIDNPSPKRPQTPHVRSKSSSPSKSGPPMPHREAPTVPQPAGNMSRLGREKARYHTRTESAEPLRSSSPSPSVRERAAAYERGIGSSESQSPTRRPPSPLKQSTQYFPPTEDLQPSRSKFSAPEHSTASPSGVASAYTVTGSSFIRQDQATIAAPMLFQRPADLSPPKRRGTYVARKPVRSQATLATS